MARILHSLKVSAKQCAYLGSYRKPVREMGYSRILVIDDEENFLCLVSKILGKEGYEVKTAADATQALKRLEEEPFDLALLDIRMHPMDGLSILEQIKSRQPDTKVIMLTADPDDKTRTLAFLKGAIAYLVKPVDIDELKETVRGRLSNNTGGFPVLANRRSS